MFLTHGGRSQLKKNATQNFLLFSTHIPYRQARTAVATARNLFFPLRSCYLARFVTWQNCLCSKHCRSRSSKAPVHSATKGGGGGSRVGPTSAQKHTPNQAGERERGAALFRKQSTNLATSLLVVHEKIHTAKQTSHCSSPKQHDVFKDLSRLQRWEPTVRRHLQRRATSTSYWRGFLFETWPQSRI